MNNVFHSKRLFWGYVIYKHLKTKNVAFPSGDIVDCDNKNLTGPYEWPNTTINVFSSKESSLVHVKAFPDVEIRKLILQNNNISKIDPRAFKQIVNLTELDLSYNALTVESLQPHVFEVIFIDTLNFSTSFINHRNVESFDTIITLIGTLYWYTVMIHESM